jgi:hypothetical protein
VTDLQVLIGRTTEAKVTMSGRTSRRSAWAMLPIFALARGKWMVKVTARSPEGTLFEQRSELFVQG